MRLALILINVPRRYEKVKGRLKGELGLVRETLEAIPTGGTKSARRVVQAIDYLGE
jgi:hypothetical protein